MDDKKTKQEVDITGNGNVVGDNSRTQVIKAEEEGIVKEVIQVGRDLNIGFRISPSILKRVVWGECIGIALLLLGLWVSQYVVPITASFDGVIVRAAAFVIPLSSICGVIYFLSRRRKYHVIDATVVGAAALTGLILLILTWVLICRSPL